MKKKPSILEEMVYKKYDFWEHIRSVNNKGIEYARRNDMWFLLSKDKKTLICIEKYHGPHIVIATRNKKSENFSVIINYFNSLHKMGYEFYTAGWLKKEIQNSSFTYGNNLKYDILIDIYSRIVEDFEFLEYTDEMYSSGTYLTEKTLSKKNIDSLNIYNFNMEEIIKDNNIFPIKNKGLHIGISTFTHKVRDNYYRDCITVTYNDEELLNVLFSYTKQRSHIKAKEHDEIMKRLNPDLQKVLLLKNESDVITVEKIIDRFDVSKSVRFNRIMDKIESDSTSILKASTAINKMLSGEVLYEDNREAYWNKNKKSFLVKNKDEETVLSVFNNLRLNKYTA